MPAKPARKIAKVRKLSPRKSGAQAAARAVPATPLLGSGWGDLGSPALRQNADLGGYARHLAMRIKVTDASKATWGSVGRVSSNLAGLPDTTRTNLPCIVRDASSGKSFAAVASVASSGGIAITAVAASTDGSMKPPFAIGLGDEVHLSFVYAM